MSKTIKRLLSLALAMLLCVSLIPAALAADNATSIAINEKNFPDANFRAYVRTIKDLDHNGKLSAKEIEAATDLYFYDSGVKNLKGIEYFTEVTMIYCAANQITTFGSYKNDKLIELYCMDNRLTELDLSAFPALEILYCGGNMLQSLDLSEGKSLKHVACANNQMSSLKADSATLEELRCSDNPLGSLDLSRCPKLQYLECANDELTKLDVSKNAVLGTVLCDYNAITELDFSHNKALFQFSAMDNKLEALDLSFCPKIEIVYIEKNPLKKLYLHPQAPAHDNDIITDKGVEVVRGIGSFRKTILEGKVNTKGKPVLTWYPVEGAVKYQVYRATSKSGPFKRITTTSALSFTNGKAEAGKTYWYKVRAVSADGAKTGYSKVVKLTAKTAKPAAPKVTGKLNDKGSPVLSWKAVEGAAKYQVWRSDSGEAGTFKLVKTTTDLSYTSRKLEVSSTYFYKVRAIKADGVKGEYSKIVQLTIRPAAPKVTGSLNDKGKPTLSWKDVDGAVKYQIWRSETGADGSFKRVKTTASLWYTDTKAKAGETWYYKVRAVTGDGLELKSAYSPVVSLTAK